MDREKVIQGLEMCTQPAPSSCRQCPYKETPDNYPHCVHHGLQMDALALLKEQEPVEPDAILTYPVCGECHEPLDVTDEYCRHCGRAVKWRV